MPLIPQRILTGEVRDVFSGDDLVVMIDLGVDDLWKKKRIRLYGVDTPNAVGQAHDTEAGRVRSYVRDFVRNAKVHITPVSSNGSSIVAVIEVERGGQLVNLNDDLIAQGYRFQK